VLILVINFNIANYLHILAHKKVTNLNINGFKYYPSPPEIIANIAKSLCMILSPEDLSWEAFKKMCADKSIIQKMKNADKDNFKYQSFKIISEMFDSGLINAAKAEKESQACLNLYNW
jgi:hypothetical protein